VDQRGATTRPVRTVMSISRGKADAQKANDDFDPPVLTKAQHGKFLDSEACVGVQNQFLTLEEAAHAGKLAFPDAQGVTMEIVDNMQIFTIRQAGPLVMVPESMSDNFTTWMLKERKVANKLNTRFRNWLNNLNALFQFISFLTFCLSIYIFVADWGNLDPGFFNGVASIMLLWSIIVFSTVYIGDKGITYQLEQRHNVDKRLQGPPLLKVYLALFVIFYVLILVTFFSSLESVEKMRENEVVLSTSDVVPEYALIEEKLQEKFDDFFFAAREAEACPDMKYYWMWLIINDICTYHMTMPACSVCYGATICEADQRTCEESGEWDHFACPYNACRKEILGFTIGYMDTIAWIVLGVILYWTLLLGMTFGMVCFNPRDRFNMMQVKLGTKPSSASVWTKPNEEAKNEKEEGPLTEASAAGNSDQDVRDAEAEAPPQARRV
jgi:hypothetical protein